MLKKLFLTTTLLGCISVGFAQESLGFAPNRKSPVVNPDSTVTLSIRAPKAENVSVFGFSGYQPIELNKGAEGVWSVTTPKLKPDLYTYSFDIDGVRTIDPANAYTARDISAIFSEVIVPGGNADLYAVQDVPHGTVSKVWYNSTSLGIDRRMTVYTPAGYEDNKDIRYPVFYLLHGMGGDEEAWNELGRASIILDNLIDSGKAEPMIVVMPNGNGNMAAAPGQTGEGMYTPNGEYSKTEPGKFEKSMADIVKYVDSHYRTIPDKSHRAIAGLSMGGGHTWRITMMMPDDFDYVGLFSAAVRWNGAGVDNPDEYLKEPLKRQFKQTPKLYWIAIGKDDFLYNLNKDYRSTLDNMKIPYEYHESEGGHTWTNWRDYLVMFTPRLFK